MKSAEIIKHYIWMTENIRRAGSITLSELNEHLREKITELLAKEYEAVWI